MSGTKPQATISGDAESTYHQSLTVDYNDQEKEEGAYSSEYKVELPDVSPADMWVAAHKSAPINMTDILLGYRNESMKKNAMLHKSIKPVRALSLDCIFLFTIKDVAMPYTNHKVRLGLDRQDQYAYLPDTVSLWSNEIMKVTEDESKDTWDMEELLLSFYVQAAKSKSDFAMAYARALNDAVRTPSHSLDTMNEDIFVHCHLHSPLHWVFVIDKHFTCNWSNAALEEGSLQSNFTMSIETMSRCFDLFVVEVVKPNQPEGSSLVKVGSTLRKMLTKLVEEKIEAPEVYALIVNGFSCKTYKMTIEHAYIFKLIELNEFELPGRPDQVACLEHAVCALYQTKTLALGVKSRIQKRYDEIKDKVAPRNYVPIEYLPPSVMMEAEDNGEGPSRVKQISKKRKNDDDKDEVQNKRR